MMNSRRGSNKPMLYQQGHMNFEESRRRKDSSDHQHGSFSHSNVQAEFNITANVQWAARVAYLHTRSSTPLIDLNLDEYAQSQTVNLVTVSGDSRRQILESMLIRQAAYLRLRPHSTQVYPSGSLVYVEFATEARRMKTPNSRIHLKLKTISVPQEPSGEKLYISRL